MLKIPADNPNKLHAERLARTAKKVWRALRQKKMAQGSRGSSTPTKDRST